MASLLYLVFTRPDHVQEDCTANEASVFPAPQWVTLKPGVWGSPFAFSAHPLAIPFTCWLIFSYLFESTQLFL